MGSLLLILKLIVFVYAVDDAAAQVALESFRLCIVAEGLSSDLIMLRSTENSTLYAKLDYRWNTRPVHTHPLAYFVPRGTFDVQVAVRCARANKIPVIPKSGGHSAELFSFGNSETIVISFENMKKIQINGPESTAVIESGALLGEINEKLLNEGGFGLSSGNCDDVGIGGIALGGGDGATTAIHNLTVDNILEMEMVDSNGDLHLVNENVNSDLFWALRGVGSGYIGIVTSFKFKLFNVTDLRTTRLAFSYDLEHVRSVFLAFQDWLEWVENEQLTVRSLLHIFGDGQVFGSVQLSEEISKGKPTNAELFLNKANDIFPPIEDGNMTLTFPSYTELRSDEAKMELISAKNSEPATYVKKTSFFVSRTFSAEELEKVMQMFLKGKNLPFRFVIFAYNGAWNEIPTTDMSYVHRGYLYLVSTRIVADAQLSDEEAQIALDFLNELEKECKFMDSGESYQNYVDIDVSYNFMERYYGINSQRLIEIKRKWDPDNYFQNEQSIPTTSRAAKRVILPTFSLVLCLFHTITKYRNLIEK